MHPVTSSNIVDSSSENTGLNKPGKFRPLCPKPRRVRPSIPEFLKFPKCNNHSHPNTDEQSEILKMIDKGISDGICNGCIASSYCGSPPRRTANPMVHDIQFIHQMELLSPFTRTKLSDQFSSKPLVS